ncbi:MAG: Tim44-like domain-containing protein [Betaproteobacteria bacterium]
MKHGAFVAVAAFAVASLVISDFADARIGGGRSLGTQRPSITPKATTPSASAPSGAASQPVMPAQPGATLPAKPIAPAAPAPSGASRWLGPIAGLAAGLGLAALFSHFGMSEGLGSFLLLALLGVGAIVVVRMLLARRAATEPPLAYAGRTGTAGPAPFEMPPAPAWGGANRIEPTLDSSASPARASFPPGFDADGFAKHARAQFIRLQAAYDAGDRNALADVMTSDMVAEVARDLDSGATRLPTKVVTLAAEVFDVETAGERHWASVRFTGTLSEGGAAPVAFDEVWNLTKPADGSSGWLLAGIQQPA